MRLDRRLAPLSALLLVVIVPFWASEGSDLWDAFSFYASWYGKACLLGLVVLVGLAVYLCSSTAKRSAIEQFASRRFWTILLAYSAAYVLLFSTLAVIGYLNFHSDVDYANFLQSFYSAAHGKFFTNCLANEPEEISIFADHNSPIMLLMFPLYLLFPYPSVLLVVSTLILAAAGLVLARFLLEVAGLDHTTTLALCAAFTLMPYFASQHFEGLSMEMFGPLLFILCMLWFEKRQFWRFVAALLLLDCVKEQVAIVMMVFPILSLLRKRGARWVLTPLLLNGAMIYLSFCVVIPHFRPTGAYKALLPAGGTSLLQMAASYLKQPELALRQVLEPFRLTYLFTVFAPNLFILPLLCYESLFLVGPLAKNLLFVGWGANIMSKHSLLMAGIIGVAVGRALGRLGTAKRRDGREVWAWALAFVLLASAIVYTPVWARNVRLRAGPNVEARKKLLVLIPKGVPIALPQNMLARFCTRNKLYNSASPFGLTGFSRPVDYVVIDVSFHPEHYDYRRFVEALAANDGRVGEFRLIWESSGLYLFKRQAR